MFKTIIAMILAAIVLVGLVSPAEAHDNRDCVTKAEFRKVDLNGVWVRRGDTRREVARLFDTPGVLIENQAWENIVAYPSCWSDNNAVVVRFDKEFKRQRAFEKIRRIPLNDYQFAELFG